MHFSAIVLHGAVLLSGATCLASTVSPAKRLQDRETFDAKAFKIDANLNLDDAIANKVAIIKLDVVPIMNIEYPTRLDQSAQLRSHQHLLSQAPSSHQTVEPSLNPSDGATSTPIETPTSSTPIETPTSSTPIETPISSAPIETPTPTIPTLVETPTISTPVETPTTLTLFPPIELPKNISNEYKPKQQANPELNTISRLFDDKSGKGSKTLAPSSYPKLESKTSKVVAEVFKSRTT